ncbi:type I-E CRISPR-associated protein Cas7/Cse4/CasC [Kallotenue papyrolyticum]|uniref:type I-E CRISPR-associated protein Cas7/Cse4/CasC n=1 Tax=Kallotenue papyrolyticum TaxID=1325125 RepID=UPI0004B69FF0|nr:type I-E CRISPR-associated protein Cas7/Cse4/CasC [Kallotenue papyrolyticum]
MIIELHLLQTFAPSNLNRDDTGTPKNAMFGGYRRARISSQCQKRAIRTKFPDYLESLGLSRDDLAERTRRVVDECVARLAAQGKSQEEARAVIATLLSAANLKLNNDETEYLLFLGRREIASLCELAEQHWNELIEISGQPADTTSGRGGRAAKRDRAASVPKHIKDAVQQQLKSGGKAIDLALFGRMVADLPDINRDAACQVAHAISTHRVNVEFDYYTAVDDLQPSAETGAGMIGTVEFNSACYYRYACIDMNQLANNLDGDRAHALKALEAFIRAMIEAIPSGKQNSFAAHNPPALIVAVARDAGQWNLVNAFERPIVPADGQSITERSIAALDDYWGRLSEMYGLRQVRGVWVVSSEAVATPRLVPQPDTATGATPGQRLRDVDSLIAQVVQTAGAHSL